MDVEQDAACLDRDAKLIQELKIHGCIESFHHEGSSYFFPLYFPCRCYEWPYSFLLLADPDSPLNVFNSV